MEKSKPTTKNTKNEILTAYNELLREIEQKPVNKSKEQSFQSTKSIVQKASSQNDKDIIHGIAELKININESLELLGKKLLCERDKFSNLQEAITSEENRLQELHEIKTNANSLEALLLAQEKRKEDFEFWIKNEKDSFEKGILDKKESWNKEKQLYELNRKEIIDQQKKEQKRDDEDYKYNLAVQRQKDLDSYNTNKLLLERELSEKQQQVEVELSTRESDILSKEQEFIDLHLFKENADTVLSDRILSAKKDLQKDLEEKFKLELTIKSKEYLSELSLSKQNVKFLESRILEQNKSIELLNKQLIESRMQSQDLAKKVIEGNAVIQEIRQNKFSATSEDDSKKKY